MAPSESTSDRLDLEALFALGPEAQRDFDASLLEANLRLTPEQRIQAQSSMTEALQMLRQKVRSAHD